jgi:tetratricopeptide (TPR) repeat protein
VLELRLARDESLVWTQTYDRQLGAGLLAIQSEIADQVARILQARERRGTYATAAVLTKNPRAYDLFLQARRNYDQDYIKDSTIIQTLEEAVRLDEGFMPAVALLSTSHIRMYRLFNQDAATRARHAGEAKRLAEAAARLMPGGAGDGPLAMYYGMIEKDHLRALAYAENVIRALPNESTGYDHAASALANLGRYAEAVTLRERALALDPLNAVHWGNHVSTLTRLRRAPEAFAALARAQELLPPARTKFITEYALYRLKGETPSEGDAESQITTNLWRMRRFDELLKRLERFLQSQITDKLRFDYLEMKAQTHLRLGQRPEATKAAEQALELAQRPSLDPDDAPDAQGMRRAYALAVLGRGDEAIAAGKRSIVAVATANQILLQWYREEDLAIICATLNRPGECVALLAKLLRVPSDVTVPQLKADPYWDNIRNDPAFQALLADPKNSAPL